MSDSSNSISQEYIDAHKTGKLCVCKTGCLCMTEYVCKTKCDCEECDCK